MPVPDEPISIPDRLHATSGPTTVAVDATVPVSTVPVDKRLMGTTFADKGVRNGIPYGEQLSKEELDVDQMYRFQPGAASALRSATRAALGR